MSIRIVLVIKANTRYEKHLSHLYCHISIIAQIEQLVIIKNQPINIIVLVFFFIVSPFRDVTTNYIGELVSHQSWGRLPTSNLS